MAVNNFIEDNKKKKLSIKDLNGNAFDDDDG